MKNDLSHRLLQLALIPEIGPNTIQNLLEKVGVDGVMHLHQLKMKDLIAIGLSVSRAQHLITGLQNERQLELELALIAKHNVHWTTILDDHYPSKLKAIQGAPPILYWKGNLLNWPERALAVVGSRQANHYGKRVIDEVVPQLVQAGYAIVSGGALGADTMAHRATLQAGGITLVVVGTGLVHTYPAQNARLFEEVVANGGAIVSNFAMNTRGLPGNFPARNRIVSGLSLGCLVVQAAAQSGAKITAHFALEQGREVFVIPGAFGDSLSAGCHELAQQGAKVVHSVGDILDEFSLISRPLIVNKLKINVESASNSVDLLVDLCSTPVSFDDLQTQLNIETGELQARLLELQFEGRVQQNFAGLWKKSY